MTEAEQVYAHYCWFCGRVGVEPLDFDPLAGPAPAIHELVVCGLTDG